MRTADLIVEDFEAGHGIRVGLVAENQIADFLVGIRPAGSRLYFDQPGENGAGFVIESVEVEQVAGGIRCDVVLERALIDFAGAFDGVDRIHFTPRGLANEPAEAFSADDATSEICGQGCTESILVNDG